MRFRDIFAFVFVVAMAVWLGWFGGSGFHSQLFKSGEINRDDARRESATVLSEDRWVEFQIGRVATKFRLLTNAALSSTDAPDYDLSNPRLGWRYAIEYELLDSDRNLIRKSEYHFRSEVRQLWDIESERAIYPIFFGKSSLVATQTRAMQVAVDQLDQRVAILRARLLSTDSEIREVVARALVQIERHDYGQRKTWNRMSKERRESITKYCVYGQELLTLAERTSLLRWQWTRCPMLGEFEQQYLFFIGDEEDQEIREEQIPFGLYVDPVAQGTIPVPEGSARVRLELSRLNAGNDPAFVRVSWFGLGAENRTFQQYPIGQDNSIIELNVDGGLLQLEPSTRMVVRAFWQPMDELSRETANNWEAFRRNLMSESDDEFEITPRPVAIRTFLSDQQPVEYSVSHFQDQPTPLRLQLRYPLGALFDNGLVEINGLSPPTEVASTELTVPKTKTRTARWEFESRDGSRVDCGTLEFLPQVSAFDWLTTNGIREQVSDPNEYFFLVPANVSKLKITSSDCRLLCNAYVRPHDLQRKILVPEDYHPFNQIQSINRSWFGLNPNDHLAMIRDNRSFVVATQSRPPEIDNDILNGDYEWIRYTPTGPWIGRQMLIPQTTESELRIRQQSIDAIYFELPVDQSLEYSAFETRFENIPLQPQLIFASDQSPGRVSIHINGQIVMQLKLLAGRGEIDLDDLDLPSTGQIEIRAEHPARFFLSGLELKDADRFLKRTAQRLEAGQLEFEYKKLTCQSEMLTLRLYRGPSTSERCKLSVKIGCPESAEQNIKNPCPSWTVTDRLYDLRPLNETPSLMFDDRQPVDTGHRCFIELGEELPPGNYTIKVQQERPQDRCLCTAVPDDSGKSARAKHPCG